MERFSLEQRVKLASLRGVLKRKKERKKKTSLKVLRRVGMECRVYAVAVPKKSGTLKEITEKWEKREREKREVEPVQRASAQVLRSTGSLLTDFIHSDC